ncbi:hypothetical protein [Echinimonas agarilytica]|uniref:Uncharacterized protein n=1 Tax=Echinimonas agarilytica TaxID=1215918 RepID=A0AA41W7U8_9GAMM|nr:hypothetical protein [Echinimonas agarilytica]MCM2680554.1 hypothetical protein [Echinimonas agarilytica]
MQYKTPQIQVNDFVTQKAHAMSFYVDGMLNDTVPFSELQIFIWDSLEEWRQVDHDSHKQSEQESVLWHLFHLLERWPESALRGNMFLRKQLLDGVMFLKHQGPMLLNCHGIRP